MASTRESNQWKETMVNQRVRYTLEVAGKLVIVESVPARVCLETGEQFFSPDTVEHLQRMVWEQRKPVRIVKVPVFEFST